MKRRWLDFELKEKLSYFSQNWRMNKSMDVRKKFTKQLIQRMSGTRDDDVIEVIVRLRDDDAIDRARVHSQKGPEVVGELERQQAQKSLHRLVEFIRQLEKEGERVSLIDTSWLTHSVLITSSPQILRVLAERNDVDLIDINPELHVRPVLKYE